jgi:predicted DsbA family dithiol-disulfide isomerase
MTRLEIVSDPVCPWCYLGAANLLKGLADRDRPSPFAIRWRPYRLDPTLPPEGIDRTDYLTRKFGDPAAIAATHARIAEMGRDVGLAYRFDLIRRSPSSLDAHRVIRWAEPEGLQTRTAMALFARYFEAGEDVSDATVLASAAAEAGLDATVVARLLAGDADRAETVAEIGQAQALGVTAVPTFIIGGRYAVSGAQPPETWRKLIDELEAAAGP